MPLPAALLIAALLLPLCGFAMMIALGRRLGAPLAGYVATFFASAAFMCCGWALIAWINGTGGAYHAARWGKNVAPVYLAVNWLPIGRGSGQIGLYLDSLTVSLCITITFVAALVHFFAIGFYRAQREQSRSFAAMALLLFAALGMTVSGSLAQLFAFWVALSIASWAAPLSVASAAELDPAAAHLLVLQRLGGVSFLIGFAILFAHLGTDSLPQLWSGVAAAAAAPSPP